MRIASQYHELIQISIGRAETGKTCLVSEENTDMTKAQPEQWKASCDGPPWTQTIGSHASANLTAKEMRKDGFSEVRDEKCDPAEAQTVT